jgi:hypothetical protein
VLHRRLAPARAWLGAGFLVALLAPATAPAGTEFQTVPRAQPGEYMAQGSVASVDASGETFRLADGTTLSFPGIPMTVRDALRPGSFVQVMYTREGGRNVVSWIEVQATGSSGMTQFWSRAPGTGSEAVGAARRR